MWPSWADMDSDNDNQIGNVSNVRTSCSSQLSLFIPITTSKKYQSRTNRNQKIVWIRIQEKFRFSVTLWILLIFKNYPIFHLEIILTFDTFRILKTSKFAVNQCENFLCHLLKRKEQRRMTRHRVIYNIMRNIIHSFVYEHKCQRQLHRMLFSTCSLTSVCAPAHCPSPWVVEVGNEGGHGTLVL